MRIWFTDFWRDFDPEDNWFCHLFKKNFDVVLDSRSPDLLIYSCYGHKYLEYRCRRVFYTAENVRPNFLECDYALSFDDMNRANHLRLPLYAIWYTLNTADLTRKKPGLKDFLETKKKFCCMVVSNARSSRRLEFFRELSKYKMVDSGGEVLNNIGYKVGDKMEFLRDYRFTIAFENSSYPGYVTEKVYQPMFVNTIPIYWGSPHIGREFNTKSFVNCHDYRNDKETIERIIELDRNPEALASLLAEPWFAHNRPNEFFNEERVVKFFESIFKDNSQLVAGSWLRVPATVLRKGKNCRQLWLRLKGNADVNVG